MAAVLNTELVENKIIYGNNVSQYKKWDIIHTEDRWQWGARKEINLFFHETANSGQRFVLTEFLTKYRSKK
jgi:hypothetical protein